ncbi:Glutaredoxin-like [Rhynchospora pubera]|uniref:Glutaredoxin-like n=1 Tax=Rhynchospora pubera TaxID=906938 RepID=A0AAV8HW66_9POAL|nr:Glutaredoxin-like [Rhynchospora pubera]
MYFESLIKNSTVAQHLNSTLPLPTQHTIRQSPSLALSLMWPKWVKTRSDSTTISTAPSSPSLHLTPHSPSLSFPTLKDLQSLLDNNNSPSTPSPSPPPLSSPSLRVFHRVRLAASALRAFQRSLPPPSHSPDHRRVVFYFTSLRIVRSTFIDCRSARSILRSLRIAFDERDVSLDHQFLDELNSLLRHRCGKISLPQLFVGGRHIGGAEEIRRLHETGELKRLVDGAPMGPPAVCQSCGGERFVLCGRCNGSRKQYSEKGGGFRACNDCNENGLRRCPVCCSVSP